MVALERHHPSSPTLLTVHSGAPAVPAKLPMADKVVYLAIMIGTLNGISD